MTSDFASVGAYARELAQFLRDDPRVAPYRGYRPPGHDDAEAHYLGLRRLLFDEGWSRYGWPALVEGLGGGSLFRAALLEQMWVADVAVPEQYYTLDFMVEVLLRFAPHLAERYAPRMLRADETWCQAFSEPEAGSDLASLRTRLEADGDDWRITGQKTWSTNAQNAQRSLMLTRSGEPGHRGLTMVFLDLDQAGVEVRPIVGENGEPLFAEIFLDGALVPADRVVGDVGGGWAAAMHILQWERGSWSWQQQARFHTRLRQALEIGAPVTPADAAALGRAYARTTALRLHTLDTVARLATGAQLGPEVALDKLLTMDAEVAVWDAIREHLGDAIDFGDEHAWLRSEFLFSRAAPIYGGTQDIQRGLVANRILGMPRSP